MRRQAAAELARLPEPATAQPDAGLSTRELEVLRLLARGLTNREVGLRLMISQQHPHQVRLRQPDRGRGLGPACGSRRGSPTSPV
ncbi:LuxR C-terminal-related transcriptional regulator [Pseudonocardia abyssalis]|uniref:Response regulator transcription factor n=1 Tax=Pseudonocardia abyssalis TaxID=2792008 RepID=A0ABS6V278_9PSEU|nr:LuxR C-terminal-related transcriptional regulator [Pseudonocardia abyssalis]MBW0114021.1 response regulator transcription factor [Pseudonocardia abyssalis]MBW0138089.1 response regulator transcription factor [Pseudonocardia abyssalis]